MTGPAPYHHGDLPAALVKAAVELLDEQGEVADLSLRAVARRAGVSTAAPYRHFADRTALLSAVGAVGYRELATALLRVHARPITADALAGIAVAYVRFALDRPGLFRVMFAESCDPTNPERVDAVAAISSYLDSVAREAFPDSDPEPVATALWALVHGLAFLYLDGKFDASSPDAVAERIGATVNVVLDVNPPRSTESSR